MISQEKEWMREQERLAKLVSTEDRISKCSFEEKDAHPGPCSATCAKLCLDKALDAVRRVASGEVGDIMRGLSLIGGADISFDKSSPADAQRSVAGLVVLKYPDLSHIVWEGFEEVDLRIPYKAGFLGFREVGPFEVLLQRARADGLEVDLVLVDGYGTLHPRRCGSASHFGVVADIPTIGVGKNLLYEGGLTRESVASLLESAARDRPGPAVEEDRERRPTGLEDACCVPLLADSGDLLGAAVRGHHGTSKPLFVSVGHRVGLRTAVEVALQCCRGTRVPEPIRQADLRTRAAVRARWTGPSPDPSRGD